MAAPFEDWFYSTPPITRAYMLGAVGTTVACHLQLISPWTVYLNYKLVAQGEVWRLLTNFFFFGPLSIDFLFHMIFFMLTTKVSTPTTVAVGAASKAPYATVAYVICLDGCRFSVRYSSMLEQNYFRNRPADFVFMMLIGVAMMLAAVPLVDLVFFGPALSFMLVYVWARQNPDVMMNFLGLLTFRAPWLPWVLCAFAYLINPNHFPVVDLVGMAAGHIYFFLDSVLPRQRQPPRPVLHTPEFLKRLFNPPDLDTPIREQMAAPGGYAWGAGADGDGTNRRPRPELEDEAAPLRPPSADAGSADAAASNSTVRRADDAADLHSPSPANPRQRLSDSGHED